MNSRLLSLLGMARRAGQLVAGTEVVCASVRRGQVSVLIAASDLSAATKKRLAYLCQAYRVCMLTTSNRFDLGRATGYSNRGVFGITGTGFAEMIMSSWAAKCQVGVTAKGGVPYS